MTRLLAFTLLVAATVIGACASAPHGRAGDLSLRVMTYNIRSGNGDLTGTAAAIRTVAPDVVALQEVDVHWAPRSNFADQATELGQQLGMAVRFARIYRLPPSSDGMPPREFGVAFLSKYPIVRFVNDSLTRLSTQEQTPEPTRMPGLLDVTIDVAGVRLRILDTHLDYRADPRVREAQVAEILNYVGVSPTGTILCGDLNAGPTAPELQPLFARLRDTWRSSNDSGFTYPAEQPTKRIDYVLTTPEFRVRSTRVVTTLASDHRPVVAELTLGRASSE